MDILDNRTNAYANDMLEKRFISNILHEESTGLNNSQIQLMSSRGFGTTKFYNDRGFNVVEENKLVYSHPMQLRFIDMKTRVTKSGTIKKKSYPIHNKPIYGMINNVLRRLSFEFTDAVKKELLSK